MDLYQHKVVVLSDANGATRACSCMGAGTVGKTMKDSELGGSQYAEWVTVC